jgi:hypothetical protein
MRSRSDAALWAWRLIAAIALAFSIIAVFGLHDSAAVEVAGLVIVVMMIFASVGDRLRNE